MNKIITFAALFLLCSCSKKVLQITKNKEKTVSEVTVSNKEQTKEVATEKKTVETSFDTTFTIPAKVYESVTKYTNPAEYFEGSGIDTIHKSQDGDVKTYVIIDRNKKEIKTRFEKPPDTLNIKGSRKETFETNRTAEKTLSNDSTGKTVTENTTTVKSKKSTSFGKGLLWFIIPGVLVAGYYLTKKFRTSWLKILPFRN